MARAARTRIRTRAARPLLSDLDLPPAADPPRPHHPRGGHEPRADEQRHARERLRAPVPAPAAAHQRAVDGRAHEGREAVDGEDHAHAGPRPAQVRRQAAEPGREEALDAAARDPVEHGPGVEAAGVGDAHPRERARAGDHRRRDEQVDGAVAVREVVGHQASDDADAVQEEEEVEGVRVRHADDVAREGGQVVEGKVDAQEGLRSVLAKASVKARGSLETFRMVQDTRTENSQ